MAAEAASILGVSRTICKWDALHLEGGGLLMPCDHAEVAVSRWSRSVDWRRGGKFMWTRL